MAKSNFTPKEREEIQLLAVEMINRVLLEAVKIKQQRDTDAKEQLKKEFPMFETLFGKI